MSASSSFCRGNFIHSTSAFPTGRSHLLRCPQDCFPHLDLRTRENCLVRRRRKVNLSHPSRSPLRADHKHCLSSKITSWGRILAATGSLPLSTPLNPSAVSVSFIPVPPSAPTSTFNFTPLALLVNGEPENVDEERAKEIVSQGDLEIRVELGMGKESAKYWTCDFSYVRVAFSFFLQEVVLIATSYTGIRAHQR